MRPFVQQLESLPENFDLFLAEVSNGMRGIFGDAAGDYYRDVMEPGFMINLTHPSVAVLGIMDGNALAAYTLAVHRGDHGEIPFLHVLRCYERRGLEDALLRAATAHLQQAGARRILCEFVPCCALTLDDTMGAMGFIAVARQLMRAPLDAPALKIARTSTATGAPECLGDMAACLVDAYVDHPERELHNEALDLARAAAYLNSAAAGEYGASHPGYMRAAYINGHCAGMAAGCETPPGLGFVLHVAVAREYQRQGIGRALLVDMARIFRAQGLRHMGLGVSLDNPALHLYERLGFTPLCPIDTYVWRAASAGTPERNTSCR